ncbi:MAG: helix-hairpin-helix domain-containing protein [Actinomycetota bacterium]
MPATVSAPAATPATPTTDPGTLVVHVSGWVTSPGLVTVNDGDRVGDALAEAGGARPGANLDAMNLARVLSDGQQVVVPGPGDENPGSPPSDGGEGPPGLIPLNTADASQLEALPGVGPVLAQRIVDHRRSRGGFDQVEDLLEVSGIGEAKLASIRDLVSVP